MDYRTALASIRTRLTDWRWRLDNLYWITDKEGNEVRFRMNWAQAALFAGMHYLNLILKARQLGFSTFVLVYMLDVCVFNRNTRCGIIDVTLDDAKLKLSKIRYAWDRLPDWIKEANPIISANAFALEWRNGSSVSVGTSHRGGTLQYLHISEFGKICAKHPEKAREIVTGALNTIQAGQIAWVESTAEGQDGRFFELCQTSQAQQRVGSPLTPLDFKFFFFPWWKAPEYAIDPTGVVIPDQLAIYFAKLANDGIALTESQKAWYAKKAKLQLGDMKREYPSTPEEAFEASVEGSILGQWVEDAEASGRVGRFPAEPGIPVHSFWDIGRRDYTTIWFAQILFGPKIRIVGYYQSCMAGLPHYAKTCDEMYEANGWTRGDAYWPHDGRVVEWGSDRSRIEQGVSHGLGVRIGTEMSLHDGINAARATLPICEFDDGPTANGRKVLKSYRWEWDEARGAWKTGTPLHDTNSHGADGFRTLATSWRAIVPSIVVDRDIVAELHKPRSIDDVVREQLGDMDG